VCKQRVVDSLLFVGAVTCPLLDLVMLQALWSKVLLTTQEETQCMWYAGNGSSSFWVSLVCCVVEASNQLGLSNVA
jgi:hypothetical protein